MAKNFNSSDVVMLLQGTHNRLTICEKTLPEKELYHFIIEGINVLNEFFKFYPELKSFTESDCTSIPDRKKNIGRLCFYFDLTSKFFNAFGDPFEDAAYLQAVEDFFFRYRKFIPNREPEILFYAAQFPDV